MTIRTLYEFDLAPVVQSWICQPSLDRAMELLSIAGEGWVLALLALALAWKRCPDRRAWLRATGQFLVILAVSGAVGAVMKRLVAAPRPLQHLGPERIRVLMEPLRLMSFPSGHAAAAAAFALWATREPALGKRRWPWLFAFLCGLSRVYVGAHWVIDVVAGWMLGVAAGVAVFRLWPAARPAVPLAAVAAGDPARAAGSEVDGCR